MTDDSAPIPHRRRPGWVTPIATLGVLTLLGGGILIGRAIAPNSSQSVGDTCAEPKELEAEYVQKYKAASEVGTEKANALKMVTTVILQHPSCFSAAEQAAAQSIKDAQEADQQKRLLKCVSEPDPWLCR